MYVALPTSEILYEAAASVASMVATPLITATINVLLYMYMYV